jgi:hypothetical protein
MLVDATDIAAAQCDAVAIEKLENLNRNLAPVIEPVAELGGGKLTVRHPGSEADSSFDYFRHGAAEEEVIVSDLIELSHTAKQLQKPAHVRFRHRD